MEDVTGKLSHYTAGDSKRAILRIDAIAAFK